MAAQEQGREDVKLAREQWRLLQAALPLRRLVFIDESAVTTNMTRLYGRAKLGARCLDKVPRVRRGFTSLLGAIHSEGSGACMVIEGSVNALVFRAYIKECLLPTLREGDRVIVDNLSVHKDKDREAKELIESVGASLLFLPAYSPDLNPIEMMWSKVKAFLKVVKARTQETLERADGLVCRLRIYDISISYCYKGRVGGFPCLKDSRSNRRRDFHIAGATAIADDLSLVFAAVFPGCL